MNESIICPAGLESFSSGRHPFYSPRRMRTQALVPDMWNQQGSIVYYEKNINDATVVENLFSDTLHRTVDSLTEGGVFTCPIDEAPIEAV